MLRSAQRNPRGEVSSLSDMMFDLRCQGCGRRETRRWASREAVSVTYCRFCKQGMSVMGIAFFAQNQSIDRTPAAAA